MRRTSMPEVARRTTRNPFRHAYARVRYDVGLTLEQLLRSHRDQTPRLYRWAYRSETALNCIIDPWLGKAARLEGRVLRLGHQSNDLAIRVATTEAGESRDKVLAQFSRASEKSSQAVLALARHRLLAYPDDADSRRIVELHERAEQARA